MIIHSIDEYREHYFPEERRRRESLSEEERIIEDIGELQIKLDRIRAAQAEPRPPYILDQD